MKKILIVCLCFCIFSATSQAQKKLMKQYKYSAAPCTTPMGEVMFAPVDTSHRRNVADNYKIWPNGTVLRVKFINGVGSPAIRQKVMQYAKQWELYGNITLNFVGDNTPETDIRILLGSMLDSLGHNSAVGTDCRNTKYSLGQTMNLDTSDFIDYDYYFTNFQAKGAFFQYVKNKGTNLAAYNDDQFYADVIDYPVTKVYIDKYLRGTTQHEFGHALGLLHEQSYPGAIRWNRDTLYKWYGKRHWSKEKVDFNVLQVSNQLFTNGMTYDPQSVMHYPVYTWQTLNNFSVAASYQISEGDKKLIAALYPKNKPISDLDVPKFVVSNFTKLTVMRDDKRKAFSIRPAFDIKTGLLMVNAYYVIRLITEDGKFYIPTANVFYSWNGIAAAYIKMNLFSNSSISYNKGLLNNLEILFPYNQMPDLQGKKFKVEFAVFQDDAATGKMARMGMFSQSPLISMSPQ